MAPDARGSVRSLMCLSMSTSAAGLRFIYEHEAQKNVSNHLHWPGGASGVTLGPGYDMKERSAKTIKADLRAIGVDPKTADEVAGAAGLTASSSPTASEFVGENADIVDLNAVQETALLQIISPAYEKIVNRWVHVSLAQHEFDALVSFVYNPGSSFVPVANEINMGRIDAAMAEMNRRVYSGGKFYEGLQRRRADEVNLFLYGAYFQLCSAMGG
jgi:hypothetical protein